MDFLLLFTRVLGKRKKKEGSVQVHETAVWHTAANDCHCTEWEQQQKTHWEHWSKSATSHSFNVCFATLPVIAQWPERQHLGPEQNSSSLLAASAALSPQTNKIAPTNTLFHSLCAYKIRLIKCGQREGEQTESQNERIKVSQNVGQKGCSAAADKAVHSWTTSQGPGLSSLFWRTLKFKPE